MSSGKVCIVLVAALVVGCATTTAPKRWLDSPAENQSLAFGGWIEVEYNYDTDARTTWGELIALEQDSIYILPDNQSLKALPVVSITRAKLTAYDSESKKLLGWTLLGLLSTPSHGVWFMFSAPVWILAGSLATAAHSRIPQIKYPSRSLEDFRKYARFPQGLPEGLDRRSMQPKPTG